MSRKSQIVAEIDAEIERRGIPYDSSHAYEVFTRRGIEAILEWMEEIEAKIDEIRDNERR